MWERVKLGKLISRLVQHLGKKVVIWTLVEVVEWGKKEDRNRRR